MVWRCFAYVSTIRSNVFAYVSISYDPVRTSDVIIMLLTPSFNNPVPWCPPRTKGQMYWNESSNWWISQSPFLWLIVLDRVQSGCCISNSAAFPKMMFTWLSSRKQKKKKCKHNLVEKWKSLYLLCSWCKIKFCFATSFLFRSISIHHALV